MKIVFDKIKEHIHWTWHGIFERWLWLNGITGNFSHRIEYNHCYDFYDIHLFPDNCFDHDDKILNDLFDRIKNLNDVKITFLEKTYSWKRQKDGTNQKVFGLRFWIEAEKEIK